MIINNHDEIEYNDNEQTRCIYKCLVMSQGCGYDGDDKDIDGYWWFEWKR